MTIDPFALRAQGDACQAAGDLTGALAAYEQAIAARPQYALAWYRKGEALYRLERRLEAAAAFWSGWLFSQGRKEMALMAGRALSLAKFPLEANIAFSHVAPAEMDAESLLHYIDGLRQDGRIREAHALLGLVVHEHSPIADVTRGAVLLDMGQAREALPYLAPHEAADRNGQIADRLIGAYLTLGDEPALRAVLARAVARVPATDYYRCFDAALDLLAGQPVDLGAFAGTERQHMLDAAAYLRGAFADPLPVHTGASFHAFETVAPQVPAQGLLLEFGVRHGHSITRLAELFPTRRLYGFDSFQGLPEAWGEEPAGSYSTQGRLPPVPETVELIAGWFADTLPGFKAAHPEPIAFMNIDCDIYSATQTIFAELDRQIVPGTVIVFDEYIGNKTWREDEFKAFQEWVAAHRVRYRYLTYSLYSKQVSVVILERGAP